MKTLPYDKAKMEQIIKKYPTPFHIYDEAGIISAAHNLQRAFQWNVGYKEYYAVKACPNPAILKLLHRNGCGMDCSSETELMLCEKLGITGEDIMFSSNDTPAREFEYARKLGAIVNLDDYTHIDFLAQHGGIPETVCLRYNSGGDFKLGNTIMGNPGDAKYGMTRRQIFDGVKKLMGLGRCARTTTNSPWTARCPKSTTAIFSSSTIPARTALRWAITTTASCARQS